MLISTLKIKSLCLVWILVSDFYTEKYSISLLSYIHFASFLSFLSSSFQEKKNLPPFSHSSIQNILSPCSKIFQVHIQLRTHFVKSRAALKLKCGPFVTTPPLFNLCEIEGARLLPSRNLACNRRQTCWSTTGLPCNGKIVETLNRVEALWMLPGGGCNQRWPTGEMAFHKKVRVL